MAKNVVVVQQSDLCKAVTLASGFCEKSSNIPILNCLLFRVSAAGISVTGTDLELAVTAPVKAKADHEFSFCIPGVRAAAYLKLLSDVELTISKLDNNWVEIAHPKGRAKVPGVPHESFPELQEMPAGRVSVPLKAMTRAISRVLVTVSSEESKPNMCGSLLESEGASGETPAGFSFSSTDGHRLTWSRLDMPAESGLPPVILATSVLTAIGRIATVCGTEDISFAVSPNADDGRAPLQFFEAAGYLIQARGVPGKFPNYRQILPKAFATELVFNREEFTGAVRRTISLISGDTRRVKFALTSGSLSIETADNNSESADPLPVDYQGADMAAGFNGGYVADFLKTAQTEKIVLRFGGERSASEFAEFENQNSKYIVMPMRL